MVFLQSRIKPRSDETESADASFSYALRAIIDTLDVVGMVRDGEHLQCVIFLAQEFGLLSEPHFLFGVNGRDGVRPHSLLLEDHFYQLLRDGLVDIDGAGRLRPRRDLFSFPPIGVVGRRLSALGVLSPREALVFAAAVLQLAGQGRHVGSRRHDAVFRDAVTVLAAAPGDDAELIDVDAICDVRRRLMPAKPVMLTPS